ncbi:transglutaminase-like domain-containing protein [Pseudonocardia thermophila]|uniref:transglutaminase-like domain-containing protein n=1 Tax=Pseudonocardia thermophila TaxID=1848 RepID=UPI00248F07ED|nr:transglutaminase-like domain-containing protein [Pseudonocardia thermophila]
MDAVAEFTRLVRSGEPLPLDRGALLIAAAAEPDTDVERWLRALDGLADGIDSLPALRRRLFVDIGLTGNRADYTDPRNSFLPHVLGRGLGIPISLAVVTIEVGRRAGIALEGVGMPGHFLVGIPGTGRYLDAFDGGTELDAAGAEERWRALGGQGPFQVGYLDPVPTTAILARMLENLRVSYRTRRRPADLERVLRMRLALGGELDHIVELADALGEQARWPEAAALLRATPPDFPPEQRYALELRAKSMLANLN